MSIVLWVPISCLFYYNVQPSIIGFAIQGKMVRKAHAFVIITVPQ